MQHKNWPQIFDRIALTKDLGRFGLKRGDVATVVDSVPHPSSGPAGIVLEVTNALGSSLHTVIVTLADIEPLRADEVLAVRQLTTAGSE